MNIGWIVGIWKSHLPGLAMKHGLPKNPPFIIRWLGFAEDDFFSPWEIHYLGNRWREYLLFFGGSFSESMMIFPLKPSFTVDFQLPWLMTPEGNGVFFCLCQRVWGLNQEIGIFVGYDPHYHCFILPMSGMSKNNKVDNYIPLYLRYHISEVDKYIPYSHKESHSIPCDVDKPTSYWPSAPSGQATLPEGAIWREIEVHSAACAARGAVFGAGALLCGEEPSKTIDMASMVDMNI